MTDTIETVLDADDSLLQRFLSGETGEISGPGLTADHNTVNHRRTDWDLVVRIDKHYLLSLDYPGWNTPALEWRKRVMAAAAAAGAAVLPVAPASYYRAATGDDHKIPPTIVEVNDQFEAVFAIKDRFYLSGYDTQEPRPLYFLCRLPGPVTSIADARESLKPESVKTAEAAGAKIVRQGDIFAIQSSITAKAKLLHMGAEINAALHKQRLADKAKPKTLDPTLFTSRTPIYGTAHTSQELATLPNGIMLARGELCHIPSIIGQHRTADHISRALSAKRWWWLTRNTVPSVIPPPPAEPPATPPLAAMTITVGGVTVTLPWVGGVWNAVF